MFCRIDVGIVGAVGFGFEDVLDGGEVGLGEGGEEVDGEVALDEAALGFGDA